MRRLARGLVVDDATADDVVQDAVLARLMGRCSTSSSERAWLHAVVRRKAVAFWRERARRSEVERGAAEAEPALDAAATLAQSELAQLLRAQVEALGPPYAEVIRLRFWEELRLEEIAQRTERPLGTVKAQLHRGLAQLRERLESQSADRRAFGAALIAFAGGGSQGQRATLLTSLGAGAGLAGWLAAAAALLAALALGLGWLGDSAPERAARTAMDDPARAVGGGPAQSPALADAHSVPAGGARVGEAPSAPVANRIPAAAVQEEPSSVTPRAPELRVEVRAPLGEPVRDARVMLDRGGGPEPLGVTAADGVLVCAMPADARFEPVPRRVDFEREPALAVVALAPGRAASARHVLRGLDSDRTVTLVVGDADLTARGRVLDPDGRPVEGARVYDASAGASIEVLEAAEVLPYAAEARTDRDGVFELAHLARSTLLLAAEHPTWVRITASVDGRDRSAVDIDLRFGGGRFVSGRVVGAAGEPVAEVRVFSDSPTSGSGDGRRSALTDELGRFVLGPLADGRQLIRAWASDGRRAAASVSPREYEDSELVLELGPVVHMTLEAVDGEGRPMAGARALFARIPPAGSSMMQPWTFTAMQLDAHGRATYQHEGDEQVHVGVYVDELGISGPVADAHWDGPDTTVRRVICALDRERRATLAGRLVDPDGAPLCRASLQCMVVGDGLKATGLTDPVDGSFRLSGLLPGTHRLYAEWKGVGMYLMEPVELDAGEHVDLGRIELPQLGSLFVEIGDELDVDRLKAVQVLVGEGLPPRGITAQTQAVDAQPLRLIPGFYGIYGLQGDEVRISRHLRVEAERDTYLVLAEDEPALARCLVRTQSSFPREIELALVQIGESTEPHSEPVEDPVRLRAALERHAPVAHARCTREGDRPFEWEVSIPRMGLWMFVVSVDGRPRIGHVGSLDTLRGFLLVELSLDP